MTIKQRLSHLITVSLFALMPALTSAWAEPFDIAAQPLEDALLAFSAQSSIVVMAPAELVAGKQAPPVKGDLEPGEALNQLLEGTGLQFTEGAGGEITIVQAQAAQTRVRLAQAGNTNGARLQGSETEVKEDQSVAEEFASLGVDQIIVTGSRLEQTNLSAGSPVRVIGSEQFKLRGFTGVADALDEVPGVGLGINALSGTNPAFNGIQTINLRRLGAERTLTLINGRRQVSGLAGTSSVDISTIPASLVDRVEILTGGGSSVYGTDAVAGVVNVILKDNFEGIEGSGTFRITDEGDGENYQFSVLAGKNFARDRGNFTAAFEYNRQEDALLSDRDYFENLNAIVFDPINGLSTQRLVDLTNPGLTGNGVLLFGTAFGPPSRFSPASNLIVDDGSITGMSGGNLQFGPDGQSIIPFDSGMVLTGSQALGGEGVPAASQGLLRVVSQPSERYIATANFNYELIPSGSGDLVDSVEFFLESKYVRTDAEAFRSPTFSVVRSGLDNPFLPAGVTPALLAGQPGFFPDPSSVYVGREFSDFGPVSNISKFDVFTLATGFQGRLFDRFKWEVFFTYGKTKLDAQIVNDLNEQNLALAVDVTTDGSGAPICRDPNPLTPENEAVSAGCVPFNVFGSGNFSQAGADFVSINLSREDRLRQMTAGFFVGGPAFDLPAGPVQFSAGYSYREDTSEIRPSELLQMGGGIATGATLPSSGEISVHEGFVEVGVPILRDLPLIKSLDLTGSGSIAGYNTVGTVSAWKIAGVWQMVDDFRLRGSVARAVRAPNIQEAFPIPSDVAFTFPGPCTAFGLLLRPDSERRLANCIADLGAENVPLGSSFLPYSAVSRPNPDLTEERSFTFTVGAVIQPRFVEGLAITVDYYNVTITDAIRRASPIDVLSSCYDAPVFPIETCSLIERDPVTNFLTRVIAQPVNFDSFDTSGIDFGLSYFRPIADLFGSDRDLGSLGVNYSGLYEIENITRTLAFIDGADNAGINGNPAYEHTLGWTYSYGPVSLFTNWRFEGATPNSIQDVPSITDYEAISYFDMSLNYEVKENVDFTIGVTNLTDRLPRQFDPIGLAVDDIIGRSVFARFRASL